MKYNQGIKGCNEVIYGFYPLIPEKCLEKKRIKFPGRLKKMF
jgi:hypothetical protein